MNNLYVISCDQVQLGKFRAPGKQLDDLGIEDFEEEADTSALDNIVRSCELAELSIYLDLIPPIEADVLNLRMQGVQQEGIARLLGQTQAGVSYRLHEALRRIAWMRASNYLDFSETELRRDLAAFVPDILASTDIEVMVQYYLTSSQTKISEYMRLHFGRTWAQGKVRTTILRSIKRLKEADVASRYVSLFESMWDHPNVLGGIRGGWVEGSEGKKVRAARG